MATTRTEGSRLPAPPGATLRGSVGGATLVSRRRPMHKRSRSLETLVESGLRGVDANGSGVQVAALSEETEGAQFLLVQIHWAMHSDRRLGIRLHGGASHVLVSSLTDGSLGADGLKVGDRVVSVNGVTVTDCHEAKRTMAEHYGARLRLLIERSSVTTPRVTKATPRDETALPSDVLRIAEQARKAAKRDSKNAMPAGILRQPSVQCLARQPSATALGRQRSVEVVAPGVRIAARSREHLIVADTKPGANLRHPKPLGSGPP